MNPQENSKKSEILNWRVDITRSVSDPSKCVCLIGHIFVHMCLNTKKIMSNQL